jgi:hypothetical protein
MNDRSFQAPTLRICELIRPESDRLAIDDAVGIIGSSARDRGHLIEAAFDFHYARVRGILDHVLEIFFRLVMAGQALAKACFSFLDGAAKSLLLLTSTAGR